ncbi:MAG TPA: hypothetical protein VEX68_27615 [Bryobacteraceae bacterium]|nr:hypothetical protein [Bryobacteraceae bacterium]
MPTYMNHVNTASPHFRRVKRSSLDALNNVLTGLPGGGLNAAQRRQVIATLGRIPHAKQLRYHRLSLACDLYAKRRVRWPGAPQG